MLFLQCVYGTINMVPTQQEEEVQSMTFIFLFERRNGEKTYHYHCYFTLIYFFH